MSNNNFIHCRYCNRSFTTKKGHEDHCKAKHKNLCNFCNRSFTTIQGLKAHTQAKHQKKVKCEYCTKEFSSDSALDNHIESKHITVVNCKFCKNILRLVDAKNGNKYECDCGEEYEFGYKNKKRCVDCGKRFTKKALVKHQKTLSHGPYILDSEPPIDVPGEWVKRTDFQGHKSFGRYICNNCSHSWYTAHAFKEYTQGCQKCENKFYPNIMWKNLESSSYSKDNRKDTDKPHDMTRCEACRVGVCLKDKYSFY